MRVHHVASSKQVTSLDPVKHYSQSLWSWINTAARTNIVICSLSVNVACGSSAASKEPIAPPPGCTDQYQCDVRGVYNQHSP